MTYKMCERVSRELGEVVEVRVAEGKRPAPALVAYDTGKRRILGWARKVEGFEESAGVMAWLLRCATDCDALFVSWQVMTPVPEEVDEKVVFTMAEAEELVLSGHPEAGKLRRGHQVAGIDLDRGLWLQLRTWSDDGRVVSWGDSYTTAVEGGMESDAEWLDKARAKFTYRTPLEDMKEAGHEASLMGKTEDELRQGQFGMSVMTLLNDQEAEVELIVWPDQKELLRLSRLEGAPDVFTVVPE